jgi:hypothetical protein
MGWWSDDIMGGDTPLDLQSFIYDALGFIKYPEDSDEKVRIPSDGFDYKKIVKFLKDRDGDDYWLKSDTGNIFHQVLGVMMMESGAPISKTLKNKMIKAAQQDEWANEDGGDEDRKDKMDAFIAKLKNYDGTSTIIKSAGLIETIGDAIMPENSLEDKLLDFIGNLLDDIHNINPELAEEKAKELTKIVENHEQKNT